MSQQTVPSLNQLAGGLGKPQGSDASKSGPEGAVVAFETLLTAQQTTIASSQKPAPGALLENGTPGLLMATLNGKALENAGDMAIETLLKNQTTIDPAQIEKTQQEPGPGILVSTVTAELINSTYIADRPMTTAIGNIGEAPGVLTAQAVISEQVATNSPAQDSTSQPLPGATPSSLPTQQAAQALPETINAGMAKIITTNVTDTQQTGTQTVPQTALPNPLAQEGNVSQPDKSIENPVQASRTPIVETSVSQPRNDAVTAQTPQETTQIPQVAVPSTQTVQARQVRTTAQADPRQMAMSVEAQAATLQTTTIQAQSQTAPLRQQARMAMQNTQPGTDDTGQSAKTNPDGIVVKKSQTGKPANAAANQNGPKFSDAMKPGALANFALANTTGLYPQSELDNQFLPSQTSELSIQAARSAGTLQIAPGIRVPVQLIAVNIAQYASQGINRFEMRLDPPELGRVDVKLEMRPDGKVTAHLTAERTETLDLLQRDARALERALNDTGLSADSDSLSFSLKDQAFNGDHNQQNASENNANATDSDTENDNQQTQAAQYRAYVNPGGIDIRV
jgi:flagellar hook-length control protein FliK